MSDKTSELPEDVRAFTDFKKRDGKRGQYDGLPGVAKFFVALFIKLPLTLCVLMPLALVYSLASACLSAVRGSRKSPAGVGAAQPSTIMAPIEEVTDRKPLDARTYDVVLFGATGFTGGLAADYLARQYGSDGEFRWALAGRKMPALERVRARLTAINPALASLPLLLADSGDEASLAALAGDTRVIASTVGPYVKYGTPLVRTCIAHGTSYCDITGEGSWVRDLIEHYHAVAVRTGARVVNLCGHDCVPWDLLTLQLAQRTRKADPEEALASVEMLDDLAGAASGGTVATIMYHLANPASGRSALGFNPMDMTLDGARAEEKIEDRVQVRPGYSRRHGSWYGFFIMATVNKECVRRSNVLNHYGTRLVYKEQLALPNVLAVCTWVVDNLLQGLVLANGGLRALALRTGLLPSPGEGPSVAQQESGFLVLTGCGTGTKGTRTKAQLYFPKDAGYRDTARMLSESAMCLAREADKLPAREGGVFTPAYALGNVLRDRLLRTGCELEMMIET